MSCSSSFYNPEKRIKRREQERHKCISVFTSSTPTEKLPEEAEHVRTASARNLSLVAREVLRLLIQWK